MLFELEVMHQFNCDVVSEEWLLGNGQALDPLVLCFPFIHAQVTPSALLAEFFRCRIYRNIPRWSLFVFWA